MPRYDNVDPEVIGPLRRDFDGDPNPAVWAQHAMEACETPRRVREEHQAEAANHGVEAGLGQGQGLSVLNRDGRVRQPSQALPGLSTISGEMSVASTEPVGPTILRAAWAEMPVPVATSSTSWPGASLKTQSRKGRK
jgi:hypothetical protein